MLLPLEGSVREDRRAEIISHVPSWYRPWVHFAIPSLLGLGAMTVAVVCVHRLAPYELLAIPVTLFVSFGFEWWAHKNILHRKAPLSGLIYRRHEWMHHVI